MNLESKVAVLESILVNLESIWGELESISAISESKSLIWKFQLFENEKSPFMRVKSHDKIADLPQLSPRKRQHLQSTTIFTKKQTKSPLKPHPTSPGLGKTPQNQ